MNGVAYFVTYKGVDVYKDIPTNKYVVVEPFTINSNVSDRKLHTFDTYNKASRWIDKQTERRI